MKYIITSQDRFIKENKSDNLLGKSAKEIVELIGSWEGYNDKEGAIEDIEYLMKEDFPEGFNNIPDTITLYRALLINEGVTINEEEIGQHYVSYKDAFDYSFLEKVGVMDSWGDDDNDNAKLWILTCETKSSNIDMFSTISNRLTYPGENEFTLKENSSIKVLHKEELGIDDIPD